VSLVIELLQKFESEITSVTLVPSSGGRFEVLVNDSLVFSKLQAGRHANPGEVLSLVENILKK
jgi:selenoprotein W-related protein